MSTTEKRRYPNSGGIEMHDEFELIKSFIAYETSLKKMTDLIDHRINTNFSHNASVYFRTHAATKNELHEAQLIANALEGIRNGVMTGATNSHFVDMHWSELLIRDDICQNTSEITGFTVAHVYSIASRFVSDKKKEFKQKAIAEGHRLGAKILHSMGERGNKQQQKKLVKLCWMEWQEKPEKYRNQSAFARTMVSRYEDLKNKKVIERWCREWKKQATIQ